MNKIKWLPERETLWERFATHVARLGEGITKKIAFAGNLAVFSCSTVFWLFVRGPKRETLIPSFYNVGVLSMPVVMLTGMFVGMVLAVQTFPQFKLVGLESRLGAAINLSLVKELGPVLAGI